MIVPTHEEVRLELLQIVKSRKKYVRKDADLDLDVLDKIRGKNEWNGKGRIIQNKINLPKNSGYDYEPKSFDGFLV